MQFRKRLTKRSKMIFCLTLQGSVAPSSVAMDEPLGLQLWGQNEKVDLLHYCCRLTGDNAPIELECGETTCSATTAWCCAASTSAVGSATIPAASTSAWCCATTKPCSHCPPNRTPNRESSSYAGCPECKIGPRNELSRHWEGLQEGCFTDLRECSRMALCTPAKWRFWMGKYPFYSPRSIKGVHRNEKRCDRDYPLDFFVGFCWMPSAAGTATRSSATTPAASTRACTTSPTSATRSSAAAPASASSALGVGDAESSLRQALIEWCRLGLKTITAWNTVTQFDQWVGEH